MVGGEERSRDDAEAEAAAWLARLDGPYRSGRTEQAFRAWLKRDPAHEAAFERAAEVWDLIPGAGRAKAPEAAPTRRLRRLAPAIAAAFAIVIVSMAMLLGRAPVHQTGVGEQQMITLDDGTRIALNTDSRIAVFYSDGERRVRLDQGEAMFEVTRDPGRPFIVDSGEERIRALGTTFVVRRGQDRSTAVTLIDGSVEVTESARAARIALLSPGERVTVSASAGPLLDRPSLEAATAWRRGEVQLEDVTLADAAAELNRYSETRLVIADPAIASLRISGVFSTGDVGEVASAIAELHGLEMRRGEAEIRLGRR